MVGKAAEADGYECLLCGSPISCRSEIARPLPRDHKARVVQGLTCWVPDVRACQKAKLNLWHCRPVKTLSNPNINYRNMTDTFSFRVFINSLNCR